jgi:hypothetical protein
MTRGIIIGCFLLSTFASAVASEGVKHAHTHGAHAHGKGELELTVQGGSIEGIFRTPMDSLLGFEHQPKTEAQKTAVAALKNQLGTPAVIVLPNPQAQCSPRRSEASSTLFTGHVKGTHSDLEFRFSFECLAPEKLSALELVALKQFNRLSEVRVQMVGPKGQRSVVLKKKTPRLILTD